MPHSRRQNLQFSACDYQEKGHVAYATLNRPEKGNALNEQMIAELTHIVQSIPENIHVLCIHGAGKNFCTGADLIEMQNNSNDPLKLAQLMQALHESNVPIIAQVQGASFGGAIGLLANCDIVIAQDGAIFCLSEVKLGLVPAIISPYVIEAIGVRAAKVLMLSAEKISAFTAMQLGLVHHICAVEALNDRVNEYITQLLSNGPKAMRRVKKLCREVVRMQDIAKRNAFTSDLLTQVRQSDEAQTRLKDFFEKKNV